MKYLDDNGLSYFVKKIKAWLGNKVDKEDGKMLSSNDYTTEEKTKLSGLKNYSLPTASASTLGGVKVGEGLEITNGVLSTKAGGGGAGVSDTLDVEDKTTVAPSIRLAEAISGVPTEGIMAFDGTEEEVPEGYEVVTNPSIPYYDIYNAIYPIGRGFIDFTGTDYSNYLGFDWVRELVGMFPVGYDPDDEDFSNISQYGGEKEVTLTEEELPELSGGIGLHSSNTATNISYVTGKFSTVGKISGKYRDGGTYGELSSTESQAGINWNIGGSQPHNNLPPYQVVAYWKRIA